MVLFYFLLYIALCMGVCWGGGGVSYLRTMACTDSTEILALKLGEMLVWFQQS